MKVSVSEYLYDKVYPSLDAINAGLLNHLSPASSPGNNGSYILICPQCGKREAYYYPGSSFINCPRRNQCGQHTSIWDAYSQSLGTVGNKQVLEALCAAANVPMPNSDKESLTSLWATTKYLLRSYAKDSRSDFLVGEYLRLKNLTRSEFDSLGYGFYPSVPIFKRDLLARGFSEKEIISAGLIPDPEACDRPYDPWKGRIIFFWDYDNVSGCIIGRCTIPEEKRKRPKYYFQPNSSKSVLYRFWQKSKGPLLAVEGTTDADTLRLMGLYGTACGGSHIVPEQASFLAANGIDALTFITDADRAGYIDALKTIFNCEPLGIVVSIVSLPAGSDDVDKLRQDGKTEILSGLIAEAVNAGTFLARSLVASMVKAPINASRLYEDALHKASSLTSLSRSYWNASCCELGVSLDRKRDAALMFARLLDWGVDDGEASRLVNSRFGISINIGLQAHG